MSANGYEAALRGITSVRGVRGAMVVAGADGLVVAESLMEGIKGAAVAALAASLANSRRSAIGTSLSALRSIRSPWFQASSCGRANSRASASCRRFNSGSNV